METLVSDLHLPIQERIQLAISRLPALTKADIPSEESCPICLNPFNDILNDMAPPDSTADPGVKMDDMEGVTKLVGCGHIFCKPWYVHHPVYLCRLTLLIFLPQLGRMDSRPCMWFPWLPCFSEILNVLTTARKLPLLQSGLLQHQAAL